jgi:hypothetical protein
VAVTPQPATPGENAGHQDPRASKRELFSFFLFCVLTCEGYEGFCDPGKERVVMPGLKGHIGV